MKFGFTFSLHFLTCSCNYFHEWIFFSKWAKYSQWLMRSGIARCVTKSRLDRDLNLASIGSAKRHVSRSMRSGKSTLSCRLICCARKMTWPWANLTMNRPRSRGNRGKVRRVRFAIFTDRLAADAGRILVIPWVDWTRSWMGIEILDRRETCTFCGIFRKIKRIIIVR